jgi:hypothetical protein
MLAICGTADLRGGLSGPLLLLGGIAAPMQQQRESASLLERQRRPGVDQLADVPLEGVGFEGAPVVGAGLRVVGVVAGERGGAGAAAPAFRGNRHRKGLSSTQKWG